MKNFQKKKKIPALTLLLAILLTCLAGCAKKEAESPPREVWTNPVSLPSPKERPAYPEEEAESESPGKGPVGPVDPTKPAIDRSKPWDGVTGSLGWYLTRENGEAYELWDAYDLWGFTLLLEATGNGAPLYYDENYSVVTDRDGDGQISDETGYSTDRRTTFRKPEEAEIRLKADVNLNGKSWQPIGLTMPFRGHFHGEGHIVSAFNVSGSDAGKKDAAISCYGFFGALGDGARVEGLSVSDATYTVESLDGKNTDVFIGPLVAHSAGAVTIKNGAVLSVKVKLLRLGENRTYYGQAIGLIGNILSVVKGIDIYQVACEKTAGEPFKPYTDPLIGLDSTQQFSPIDCRVLMSDPRK